MNSFSKYLELFFNLKLWLARFGFWLKNMKYKDIIILKYCFAINIQRKQDSDGFADIKKSEVMGIHEIKLKIQSEADLYNPFDVDETVISDDVASYITQRYREKYWKDKLVLNIISGEDIDLDKLNAALRHYIDGEFMVLLNERQKNLINQIWMFFVGAVLIGIRIYAPPELPVFARELISTVGAFSLWEASSIWIVKSPAGIFKRKWLEAVSKTEIKLTKI